MKAIVKFIAYRVFYPALLALGFDRWWRRNSKNRRLIIMYHGVSRSSHFDVNGRHMPATDFERQLRYFKRNFDVVPLETICRMKADGRTPPRHTIALTFDDGLVNNIHTALPLLEKYQLPATFFVCPASLDNPNYIHPADYLDILRVTQRGETIVINGESFFSVKGNLVSTTGVTAYQYVRDLAMDVREAAWANLLMLYPRTTAVKAMDEEVYKLVSRRDMDAIASNRLISIGSHCFSHINLTMLSRSEKLEQLEKSKQNLRESSDNFIDALAFPDGLFDKESIEAARTAGYEFLIGAGEVEGDYQANVFPRIGMLCAAGTAWNMVSISKGFARFGF